MMHVIIFGFKSGIHFLLGILVKTVLFKPTSTYLLFRIQKVNFV